MNITNLSISQISGHSPQPSPVGPASAPLRLWWLFRLILTLCRWPRRCPFWFSLIETRWRFLKMLGLFLGDKGTFRKQPISGCPD